MQVLCYNRYLFNGKESQTLLADNAGVSDFLDYGARHYNANTGRWSTPDPLAEKFKNVSSYLYCLGDPVNTIDPDGRIPWPIAKVHKGVERRIVSGMYRNDGGKYHGGVDINHKKDNNTRSIAGGEIVSTHQGEVTKSYLSETAGNMIQITQDNVRTTYMHMENSSPLKKGESVKEGQTVGTVGTTGRSTGNHLHYQIEVKDEKTGKWVKINPVVGDPQKVDQINKYERDKDVTLKDPQIMIDEQQKKNQTSEK